MSECLENIIKIEAARTDIGKRADVFIAENTELTRSSITSLLEKNQIIINGNTCKKSARINEGDMVEISMPEPTLCEVVPENIPLDIIYEDNDIIVINKAQGMVVHPAPGHSTGTLVSALMYHCGDSLSDINGIIRPGIVHRIDRDTSGLIAVAKNNDAHLKLSAQLEDHSMSRTYYAIVRGHLESEGTIDAPIDRHPIDRKKMAVVKTGGRNAVTHYKMIEEMGQFSMAEIKLETGRTHQIRVHFAHIGHPVIFDPVYGAPTQFEKHHPNIMDGQCLHAGKLSFVHPSSGNLVTFEAPLPDNYKRIIELLRNTVAK